MARLDLVGSLEPVYNLSGALTDSVNLSGTLSFTNIQYLYQLQDVHITSPANGDTLIYNAVTQEWENGAGSGGTDDYNDLNNKPSINSVTLSGALTTSDLNIDYNDLDNLPTIPAAQVNADWDAVSGVEEILNKPVLADVATSGSYNDLLNKPSLAAVATSGSYNDLLNKPTIPAAQVNSDWNANSGVEEILNKPSLATVATSGLYSDLTGTPTIPGALNDLSDVTITSPASSEGLIYDGSKWTNAAIPSGVTTLAALSDVDVSGSLYNNQVLSYNSGTTEWQNKTLMYSNITGTPYKYSTNETEIGTYPGGKTVYMKSYFFNTPISCAAGNTSAAGTWTSLVTWNDSITLLDFKAWSNSGNAKTFWGHLSAQWSNTNLDIRALNIRSTAAPVDGFTMIYYYN